MDTTECGQSHIYQVFAANMLFLSFMNLMFESKNLSLISNIGRKKTCHLNEPHMTIAMTE